MSCSQCQGIEDLFDKNLVSKELALYRLKGPDRTTRMLVEELKKDALSGWSLLDIGGGVGAVEHALIEAGIDQATDVDASSAYLSAAKEEAGRRGLVDRIHFQHGNYIDLAPQIAEADIVTLSRVVCCYPDMERLVGLSAAHAKKLYGLVYPRDTWFVRFGVWIVNLLFRLQRKPFRTFVHSTQAVDEIVRQHDLQPQYSAKTLLWQVVVYCR